MTRLTVNLQDAVATDLRSLASLTPKRSLSEEAAIAIEGHLDKHRAAIRKGNKLPKKGGKA